MEKRKTYLIPHRNPDGDLVFNDAIFGRIYDRIIEDGYEGAVFYSGLITRDQWLEYCKKPGVAFYVLIDEKCNIILAVWLDSFSNRAARINYCTFKVGFRDIVSLSRDVIQELLHKKDENGEYLLDTLIGYTPKENRIGIKFAKKCGAEEVGTIKKGVWIDKEKRSAPCLVTSFERHDENIQQSRN